MDFESSALKIHGFIVMMFHDVFWKLLVDHPVKGENQQRVRALVLP